MSDVTDTIVRNELLKRETKLADAITGTIAWYSKRMCVNWYFQRCISVIVMICGVIAPLLVAKSSEQGWQTSAAVVVTVMPAVLEGLRRNFR